MEKEGRQERSGKRVERGRASIFYPFSVSLRERGGNVFVDVARFERDGRGNAYFPSHPSIAVRGEISSIEKNVQRFSRNLRV